MLTAICMLFTLLPFNVLTVTAADGKFGGDGTPQNPYLIEDAADLNAFRDKVNGGNTNINGRLVNDIDLNENFDQDLFAVDGNGNATYNGSPDIPAFEQWTPIGYNGISGILAFNGTLDGDGHTISGLYINTADDTSNKYYALIGYLGNGGTVKNLGIENSVVKMNTINIYAAGIVGNNEGTIENCYNDADIYGNSDVGGIALGNFNIIRNCYNTGTVTSTLMSAGGIAVSMYGGGITNCYFLEGSASVGVGSAPSSATYQAESITADEMKSPDFAATLNGNQDPAVWRTDVTALDLNGGYPILSWQSDFSSGGGTENDPFLIYTKEDLEAFRNLVNEGYTSICGKLVNDIVLNTGDLSGWDGVTNNDWAQWTPIGNGISYTGTFDGNGKTVSGVYIDDTGADFQGLFGYVSSGGVVKNVGVVNSYIRANDYVGGVVGYNYRGTVENSYNTGSVSATGDYAYAGGVVGDNYGTVTNCYNTGSVSVTKDHANAGGVAGNNIGTVTNSYNTGSVSATENNAFVGGVVGRNNSTAENCYYLDTTAEQGVGYGSSDGAQEVSIEDVEDAENGLLAKLAEGSGEGVWNIQLSAMGSWEYGKPAVQPVLSWQTVIQNAPAYIVTIPEKATAGGEAVSVSLSEVGALRADQYVAVSIAADTEFELYYGGNSTDDAITCEAYANGGETALTAGETILTSGNTAAGVSSETELTFEVTGQPKYAGSYIGTITFNVTVQEVSGV